MTNRTFKYLQPSFKLREKEFQDTLFEICVLNYFAIDSDYYTVYNLTKAENIIFLLVDTLGYFDHEKKSYSKSMEQSKKDYNLTLNKLRQYSFFVTNYKTKETHKEVIVFQLPEVIIKNKQVNVIENFFEGKYSELWTDEQLEVMFTPIQNGEHYDITRKENSRRANIKGILQKNPDFKKAYIDIIYSKFGTSLAEIDVSDNQELDIPAKLDPENEILGNTNILYQIGVKNINDIKIKQENIN